MAAGIETERKFIIRKPDISFLEKQEGYGKSEIVQTYFQSQNGVTHRVRRREGLCGTIYTETKKTRLSPMSVIEDEKEITEGEYSSLLSTLATVGKPVHKTRHIFRYRTHTFEVDIYPFWERSCIMEVEFSEESEVIEYPPFIEILEEVTGIKGYSNHSIALSYPKEKY